MAIRFFTKPTPPMGIPVGEANGYAVIPKSHPMHGVGYDDIPIDVHGGLTFACNADQLDWEEIKQEDKGGWVVGFDTCHSGDNAYLWPVSAVNEEAKRLAEQLEELSQ